GTARYEFQVESPKIGFTELVFGHDPGFVPTSVRVNNLVSWTASPEGSEPSSVVIRLREPTRSAVVVLTGALTVPTQKKPWASPGVWLKSGILRSERLKIVLSQSCSFQGWDSKGFRLVRSELGADQSYTLEAERVAPEQANASAGRPRLEVSP